MVDSYPEFVNTAEVWVVLFGQETDREAGVEGGIAHSQTRRSPKVAGVDDTTKGLCCHYIDVHHSPLTTGRNRGLELLLVVRCLR